jgi:hypothetical protein
LRRLVPCAEVGSGTPIALGQDAPAASADARARLEVAEDILDHDHRGIDDDAEVDRAERQQVGVLALQHQDDDGEEQRERNVDADDDGAAQIAEEDPLDEEDQHAAEDQIVQDRMRGDPDQRTAIVIGTILTPGGRLPSLLIFSTSA